MTFHYEIKMHGIVWSYSRSVSLAPLGKLISITEPHGESVQLAYDSSGNLLSLTTGLAGQVTFARDSQSRIISATRVRDGLTYLYSYGSNGQLASSSDFEENVTAYQYLPVAGNPATDGLLASITDPLGRALTFQYQADGRASSQTEPGNAVRRLQNLSQSTPLLSPSLWPPESSRLMNLSARANTKVGILCFS